MEKCPKYGIEGQDKDIFCGEWDPPLTNEELSLEPNSKLQEGSSQEISHEEDPSFLPSPTDKELESIEIEFKSSETDIKLQEDLTVCKRCGKEFPNGAAFCMYCGTPVGLDSPSEVEVPSIYVDPKPNKVPLSLEKDFDWKLMECPFGYKEVSRFGISYPNCGNPFSENAPKPESASSNTTSNSSDDSREMGILGIVMAVIVGIILISLLSLFF